METDTAQSKNADNNHANADKDSLRLPLDLAGGVLLVKGHVKVSMIWHVWSPAELHGGAQGKGHHAGMPRSTSHIAAVSSAARVLEALDPVDGPEVRGECWVAHVLVGHVEVALVSPPQQTACYC